jgi:hypothetical protein
MRVRPIVACPLPFLVLLVRLQRGNPTAPGALFLRPTIGLRDEKRSHGMDVFGKRPRDLVWASSRRLDTSAVFSRTYTIFIPTFRHESLPTLGRKLFLPFPPHFVLLFPFTWHCSPPGVCISSCALFHSPDDPAQPLAVISFNFSPSTRISLLRHQTKDVTIDRCLMFIEKAGFFFFLFGTPL